MILVLGVEPDIYITYEVATVINPASHTPSTIRSYHNTIDCNPWAALYNCPHHQHSRGSGFLALLCHGSVVILASCTPWRAFCPPPPCSGRPPSASQRGNPWTGTRVREERAVCLKERSGGGYTETHLWESHQPKGSWICSKSKAVGWLQSLKVRTGCREQIKKAPCSAKDRIKAGRD